MTVHTCPYCDRDNDYEFCRPEEDTDFTSRPVVIVRVVLSWWRCGITQKQADEIRAAIQAGKA